MLLIGDSGTGKTGALMSLARAGYNLRIIDLDNGMDILAALARNETPEVQSRIIYETVTEKMRSLNGKPSVDGIPKQFAIAVGLMDHWKVPEIKDKDTGAIIQAGYDLGRTSTWGPNDVLVIDSLTMMSRAAMNHALALNNRLNQQAQQQDWGQAMGSIEDMLALLYSSSIRCNVIVISHITYVGGDENGVGGKGYPNTLGQKLPPKVGRYFNSILLAKVKGSGAGARRLLVTQPEGMIDVKNPSPLNMPRELDLNTGLAEFFKIVRGGKTPTSTKTPAPSAAAA